MVHESWKNPSVMEAFASVSARQTVEHDNNVSLMVDYILCCETTMFTDAQQALIHESVERDAAVAMGRPVRTDLTSG